MNQRPYVIVNVAQSINGYISGRNGRRVLISSPEDMIRVHKLRAEVDAILVGSGTIITDDPRLLVDQNVVKNYKPPLRVVLDRSMKTQKTARVYDTSAKTLVYTARESSEHGNFEIRTRDEYGLKLPNILSELHEQGIRKVLVEGGRNVITEFIEERTIDEFHLFIGDILIEDGGLKLFSPGFEIRNVIRTVRPLAMGVLISLDPYHLQRLWNTQVKDI